MNVRPLRYARPESVQEAVAILDEIGPKARILAGGTDLIPQVNEYIRDADVFVDGKRIPELMELRFESDGTLLLGAAVPCYRFYADPRVCETFHGLVDAARIIGSTGIQGRASIGGNLCNSGPAADSIPPLIVYSAVANIAGRSGFREVPVEDFCIAPGQNVLERGELLVSLRIPTPASRSGGSYLRFIPRNEMDIAVAGSAAILTLDTDGTVSACRIALSAVAPRPLFVPEAGNSLVGSAPSDEAIAQAAALAQAACSPITDMRGTAARRKHLVGVLTRRALTIALERVRNDFRRGERW
jgi:carbon-monoxide dehydrogenase medium subunit